MLTFIADIIDELTMSVQPHDCVRLTITSQSLVEISRIIQSNDIWLFCDFYLNFIHAMLPFGGRWGRGAAGCLASYLLQKCCITQINNKYALCCALAIVMARAMLDNHPK